MWNHVEDCIELQSRIIGRTTAGGKGRLNLLEVRINHPKKVVFKKRR